MGQELAKTVTLVAVKNVMVLLEVGRTGITALPVAVVNISVLLGPEPGYVGQSVTPHCRSERQQPPPVNELALKFWMPLGQNMALDIASRKLRLFSEQ